MNFKQYNATKLVAWIVILFLVETSILAFINPYLENLPKLLKQIIDVGSLFGSLSLVFLFLKWYDEFLWRYLPKWLNLVSVPNVNGEYEGTLTSSHKDTAGNPISLTCNMIIKQTASDIYIEMEFINAQNKTTSYSHSEQIENFRGAYHLLRFIHHNEGNYNDNLNEHSGLTSLRYYPATKEFKGDYYNDPQRKTFGKIELKKKP